MPAAGSKTLPAEVITSRENRWVKIFRAALHGTDALADGLAALEGPRLVAEALRSGLHTPAILYSDSGQRHFTPLAAGFSPETRRLRVSDRLFASLAGTESPQGIAALVRPRPVSFDDLLTCTSEPLLLVLVGVQDPGNVGTAIRAAEAFGSTGVITTGGTAHPWAPKSLRASAGSILRVPVLHGLAPAIAFAQLRVSSVKTYAATTRGSLTPATADLRAPAAFLIGNEGAGLPPDVAHSADAAIRIPLSEPVESLNAAMAATVLLYEAARQRGTQS
jgi:TrmH family RNA methyltransferase